MVENTSIEWADHTFSPWLGCTRVSPACQHCYAEGWAKRSGLVQWGPKADRRLTSDQNWKQPLKWNAAAHAAGRRDRVFCASLADVFDDHPSIQPEWRHRLWNLIAECQNLEWLLLTKRPTNWPFMLPVAEPRYPFSNVRLGTTIEDQPRFDERWPVLQFAADIGWPTFVSYEPALGLVDWTPAFEGKAIGWLISGGESGGNARPSHPDWFRSARDLCAKYGVPYLHKQWGEWRPRVEAWEPKPFGIFPDGSHYRAALLMGPINAEAQRIAERHSGQTYEAIHRVGKKAAGRLLDGIEHNGMPEVANG